MYTILEFSDMIETMLDLTSEHKFEIKFERLENGKIYAIVSDGIGEISIDKKDNCDKVVQSMIESCKDWIDEKNNQDDSDGDDE